MVAPNMSAVKHFEANRPLNRGDAETQPKQKSNVSSFLNSTFRESTNSSIFLSEKTLQMNTNRQNCLIVLSGAKEGNSSQSFIQSFSLLNNAFNVQIATPTGRTPEFVKIDEQSRKWFNEFKNKSFSTPISLSSVDPNRYSCLVIPHSPGSVIDLVTDSDLSYILKHFVKEKKAICAIGMGVTALFPAYDDGNVWSFRRFTLTAISVFELARTPDFVNLPIIPEDVIKHRGALYSSTNPDHVDEVHVVVDRHLITGQNEHSTRTAVQNLILQCNQRQNKSSK